MSVSRKRHEGADIRFEVLKHELYKEHVADGAAGDGEEHLFFPQVEPHGGGDGNQLGQAVAPGKKAHVFQAVDHQHAEDGGGEGLAQILNEFGRGAFAGKNQKGQKSGGHSAQNAYSDSNDLLSECHVGHTRPPAFSIGFRKIVSRTRMQSMVGTMKESAPKHRRQMRAAHVPMRAV